MIAVRAGISVCNLCHVVGAFTRIGADVAEIGRTVAIAVRAGISGCSLLVAFTRIGADVAETTGAFLFEGKAK